MTELPNLSRHKTSFPPILIELDKSKVDLHAAHESFVTNMKWTMNSSDSVSFENIVMLDGQPTKNKAELKRVY